MNLLLTPYVARTHAAWAAVAPPGPQFLGVSGTLVFADVSGFTPLTERLARLGKVGAEKLTDVLNEVFGGLLDVAEAEGGDLLKFGGDALLLLFAGEGHAERAVTAAHAMQAALRPYRRLRTEGGTVSLRMSVGVASGVVDCFLVGDRHRELLVGGPVVDEVVALESAAGPGEVLVGNVEDEREPTGSTPPAPPPGYDPAECVPVSLRAHLGAGGDGEHRVAVLTFVKAQGLSAVLREEGGAAAAAAMHEAVVAVQAACDRTGVTFLATDVDGDGAKILLSAGAPVSTTEDADRMLDALIEVVEGAGRLPMRAGVNCGRAFAVDVGSVSRRTYAVMGDATNLAARVMGKAAPGTVLATTAALETVRSPFDRTPLPPFPVKGKSAPVEAAEVRRPVLAAHPDASESKGAAGSGGGAPLVGRDRELAVLREALARGGVVVELVGEPGIGKSRLVRAFADEAGAAGVPVVSVEAAPYATASPYFALRAPLRRLVDAPVGGSDDEVVAALAAAVERAAPRLAPLLPLLALPFGVELPDTPASAEVATEFRAARVQMLVVELVEALLPGPAAFVVEDAHWLDAVSADLVGHLLDRVGERPWAVCVARRDVESGFVPADGPALVRVPVGPLGADAARELVRVGVGDRPLSAAEQAALLERSGGNPLFLLELLTRGGDVASLPDSVEALIAARIDTLARPQRSLLHAAAVLGGRFDAPLVAALLEGDAERAAATLGALEGFLAVGEDGRYHFRHALLRDVAYERLPFRRRRELHARAGELVEAAAVDDVEEWSDLLSLHYTQAHRDAEAWRYSRMAGDRARRTSAPVEAAVFYRRAVEAARRLGGMAPADVASVYEALGDVCELSGRYAEAADAYRAARRLRASDPLAVAELCRKEGWLRERSGRYAEALRWFTKGEGALASVPTGAAGAAETATRLRLARGVARARQGKYAEALPLVEQAAAEAEALGDKRTLAHAYYVLEWVLSDQRSDKAEQYRLLALPIYEELGDLTRQGNVYNNLGVTAFYDGRWDEAVELYERSRELWQRSGDAVQLGTAANNIGEVRSDQGRLDEAVVLFEEALTVWRAAAFPVGIALAKSNLGRVAVRGGRFDEGEALLVEAREAFRAIGAESFVLETEARRAERCALAGEGQAALEILAAARQRAERLGTDALLGATLDRIEGWARVQVAGPDAARRFLVDAVARAVAADADYEAGLMYDTLARLGDDEEEEAAAAAERFTRLGVVRAASPFWAPFSADTAEKGAQNAGGAGGAGGAGAGAAGG